MSEIDVREVVEEYIFDEDWRIKANANQGRSVGGHILQIAGKVNALYWLDYVFPKWASDAHKDGAIHIHDLDMLTGYCAGWSLKSLLREGFHGVKGKLSSKPAGHFGSALNHMVNFMGTLQNEWAGAQAFSSFDTLLAPYVYNDGLTYKEVKQHMQHFIYGLNVGSRWGSQTPFTNLTMDLVCPEDMKDEVVYIQGDPVVNYEGDKETEATYGEFQREMDMINRAFVEVMLEGDDDGQPFTFPIPTYNVTKDMDWDSDVVKGVFEMAGKYGTPYFQNFLNSDMDPSDVRSMCCRLQLDLKELKKRGGGLFGSGEQTGSIGVVTLNCARIGKEAMCWEDIITQTDKLIDMSVEVLEAKRKFITARMEDGYLPWTKVYLGTFRNHFSTIGVNGINEMLMNFNGTSTAHPDGVALAEEYLEHIRNRMTEIQEKTGNMYNLEATPAEGATYRFAREDYKRYGDSIMQAGEYPHMYYTNSSQLPVDYGTDPFEALELQDSLQTKYTGGTVLHVFAGQKMSGETAATFVRRAFENFRLPYLTITPLYSTCSHCGYIEGEVHSCPTCGDKTEVWTRVMGYLRPKSSYNIGKKKEADSRVCFDVK